MFVKNPDIVLRNIHGSYFLIDITQNYLDDTCSLYEINETGEFIWKALDEFGTVKEIVDKLVVLITDEIDYGEVYSDVEYYINILIAQDFVEVENGRD